MSVVETIYPDSVIAAGVWSAVGDSSISLCIDETGTHDGDTTYATLVRTLEEGAGTTQSEFEVGLGNPTTWVAPPVQVRSGEAWKSPVAGALSPRQSETWKSAQVVRVRQGEAWKFGIPQLVVRVTAKKMGTATYDIKLKDGTTLIASTTGTPGDPDYAESTLTVDAASLVGADPTNLRVAIDGSVTVVDADAELRVTQVKVELND